MSIGNRTQANEGEFNRIVVANLDTPYANAYTDQFNSLEDIDIGSEQVDPAESTDIDPNQVGEPIGITANDETVVAEAGDTALSMTDALKDEKDSCIGPQWGEGRTTWHPSDVEQAPSDVDTGSAVSAIDSGRHKRWLRRCYGEGSYLKRITDGTADDIGGKRHEYDVWLRIRSFCEQLGFHGREGEVKRVYDELPPEPFQPIGGHQSTDCTLRHHRTHIITDVHPPQTGVMESTGSDGSWNVESIKVPHDPSTCPECSQCRCGNYHLGKPPSNGIETKILGAMLIVDERRIKAADNKQEAFSNRLQEREGYNELVTQHALNPLQALQTAREHHDTEDE